ncbi:MAG: polynucleotide adenylyltransferase PcnB [Nitrococcus mobilis]|nr:polynucleotide adenylyltransferase PcnB [Nitrococcus mobilis]
MGAWSSLATSAPPRSQAKPAPCCKDWYYTRTLRADKSWEYVTELAAIHHDPVVISRSEHGISRANISRNALKVLYRLNKAGYAAYLVGGGVRDLSLGREPKDFDVATDARPEQVKQLFRNCRLIGRRFRLAHVYFGCEIIEVATFRALQEAGEAGEQARVLEDGRLLRDNVFGTIEEDALRRDFTVNALYYHIADFTLVDYVGGMADLRRGVLRLIGDAEVRYREDPVRMLRAVRFAVKLGFRMHPETAGAIPRMAHLLGHIPPARLFDETLKLFATGMGLEAFECLRHYGLFGYLFPATEAVLLDDEFGAALGFLAGALANTDRRVAEGKSVTPAFLFAALLWPSIAQRLTAAEPHAAGSIQEIHKAASEVLQDQARCVTIPKRFSMPMREIWSLQPRFERRTGKRALRLLSHPRFRAAYDFLLLRAEAGEVEAELARWWTQLQLTSGEQRTEMAGRRRRSGNRRGRHKGSDTV